MKCSVLYKGGGLCFNIYMCYSWEVVLMSALIHQLGKERGMEYGNREDKLIV